MCVRENLSKARQGCSILIEFSQKFGSCSEERESRKILLGQDSQGRIHAVCYLVWNADCVWYLIGGGDPELRSSGATSLVIWDAIKFAAGERKIFDFEGSMIEPIERFFRGFGALQVPYFTVSRSNSLKFSILKSFISFKHDVLSSCFK